MGCIKIESNGPHWVKQEDPVASLNKSNPIYLNGN